MGICGCSGKSALITQEILQKGVATCIETNDLSGLAELYDYFIKQKASPYILPSLTIDDTVITIQGVELNALAYAFRCGRTEMAKYLIETANASVSRMAACFQAIGKSPLHILCEYGHVSLLEYYLPKSHAQPRANSVPSFHESFEEISIFTECPRRLAVTPIAGALTPAQKACEKGYVDVLRVLKAFASKHGAFPDIDLHFKDDKTGENCALIACRAGHLPVLKFLFEECSADFSVVNKRRESGLQLLLLSAKRHPSPRFLECVRYLVEKVKVDIQYEYEETLLLVEDKSIEEYLENQLFAHGVMMTKWRAEERNAIVATKAPISQELLQLESRLKDVGTDFELSRIFRTELRESKSLLSSITPLSDVSRDLSGTPVFKEARAVD